MYASLNWWMGSVRMCVGRGSAFENQTRNRTLETENRKPETDFASEVLVHAHHARVRERALTYFEFYLSRHGDKLRASGDPTDLHRHV